MRKLHQECRVCFNLSQKDSSEADLGASKAGPAIPKTSEAVEKVVGFGGRHAGCASHLFHPPRKPWNYRPPPDTLAGMGKTIETFLTIVREALS